MKIYIPAFCLQLLTLTVFSQNNLSGVLNQYAKVTALDPCSGKLTLTTSAAFDPGVPVLLIQMQGAAIDQSNSAGFGDLLDLGSAGFFEKNEIAAKNGNDVFLKYSLLNAYDVSGSLQLVTFPVFTDAVVTDTLKAAPWNGETGGVLAFSVENTLTLQAPVDISGAGFRGGMKNLVTSGCTFLTNANDYFYDVSNWRGAAKGEGIAVQIPAKEHGRGAQGNGGGGGNDHNSGGGGGANITTGGVGGKQTPSSTFGCYGNFPGRGGKAAPNMAGRIFMGGGGGAGHTDDAGAGSGGGHGGGILILQAGSITGNNQLFRANGKMPPHASGDGAGGGGAGGTIILDAATVTGSISIEAKGGNGGNVSNAPDRCFGPGGGGSGGRLMSNLTGFASVNLVGGSAGINSTPSTQCNGSSNEAAAGTNGIESSLAGVPASTQEIVAAMVLQQPQPVTVCEGEQVIFSMQAQGISLTYQWQVNTGTGWTNLMNNAIYSGTQTPELLISNASAGLNGNEYRCLLADPCTSQLFTNTAGLTVISLPIAGFTVTALGNGVFQFENTSTGATGYIWEFGDGNQSSNPSPTHTYADPGTFTVTLTATGACGSDVFSQAVAVIFGQAPQADFFTITPAGCAPITVQFENQSTGSALTGFYWQFDGGSPANSQEENPEVTYSQPGVYDVTLTVTNALGESTVSKAAYVMVFEVPQADFSFAANGQTVTFSNQSAGGTNFLWLFGDGTSSTEENPVHVYPGSGVFNVILSVTNADCGSAISYLVPVGMTGTEEVTELPSFSVFPNPFADELTVVFSENVKTPQQARLWDGQGRICKTLEITQKQQSFSMAGFPACVYLLEAGNHWVRVVKI